MNNYNELNFKEMVIHTSVNLRNNIVKQKSFSPAVKQPEVPLENNNTPDQECVKCRIF